MGSAPAPPPEQAWEQGPEQASPVHRVAAQQVATTVHGHFLVAAPTAPGPHPLVVGFHGYGQTARAHLAELARIPGAEGWLLCAVQALYPFYLRGSAGEVGASWMTRFNRELAIADNIRYVDAVVAEVRRRHAVGPLLAYVGFSQGVAMAYRAAAAAPPARALVVLAGNLPPDVTQGGLGRLPRVLIGCGRRDGLYPESRLAADVHTLAAAGVAVEPHVFDGGHQWVPSFRQRVGELLASSLEHSA